MKPNERLGLAIEVGEQIDKARFEVEMDLVFEVFKAAMDRAHL